jgi:hypothetical protein
MIHAVIPLVLNLHDDKENRGNDKETLGSEKVDPLHPPPVPLQAV